MRLLRLKNKLYEYNTKNNNIHKSKALKLYGRNNNNCRMLKLSNQNKFFLQIYLSKIKCKSVVRLLSIGYCLR